MNHSQVFRGFVRVHQTTQLASISNHTSSPAEARAHLAPPPSRTSSLSGTVPYHTSYLLLHTLQAPDKWPSVFLSRLYLELQRGLKEHDGLVNFCWQDVDKCPQAIQSDQSDHEETYRATLWKMPRRGGLARRVELPALSINRTQEILDELFSEDQGLDDDTVPEPSFYVCTHANRDCRCGIRGGEFAEALRKELKGRGMLLDRSGNSRVHEVGHVGGHKNAPNIIVFPQGDWFGNLESSDIPSLLDHWLRPSQRPPTAGLPDCPNTIQWRGRMGMTRDSQTRAAEGRT